MSEISLNEAAEILKLDKATLLRMEKGRVPSAETLVTTITFLLSADDPRLKRRSGDRKRARSE